eukprot:14576132-Heterocapsa_arctica.AAC.1
MMFSRRNARGACKATNQHEGKRNTYMNKGLCTQSALLYSSALQQWGNIEKVNRMIIQQTKYYCASRGVNP